MVKMDGIIVSRGLGIVSRLIYRDCPPCTLDLPMGLEKVSVHGYYGRMIVRNTMENRWFDAKTACMFQKYEPFYPHNTRDAKEE
ncbi:MAG: hypothetical protein A2284_04985 [Deltaproteobacteria bacterium RIFOXYA12_FULL_61_11]|nr:MAG: hypothetical protein A2284_04985 [Deltaproteobacteria bacterium RIFOXYA12_FULL_61_11]